LRQQFAAAQTPAFDLRAQTLIRVFLVALALAGSPVLQPVFGQKGTEQAETENETAQARTLVHILDYMAQDYPEAVVNGEVVDTAEYDEMKQFSEMAATILQELVSSGSIEKGEELFEQTSQLRASVERMESPETVASQARAIRDEIIRGAGLPVSPAMPPDLVNGQTLFGKLCTSCHGEGGAGDGPLAPTLDPAPADFVGGDRAPNLSPFQAFNTIRLGVEGTSMSAFGELSEQEVWDVAFFVKSLKARAQQAAVAQIGEEVAPGPMPVDSLWMAISLHQAAAMNDMELEQELEKRGISRPAAAVAAIRRSVPGSGTVGTLAIAERLLLEALRRYKAGDVTGSRQQALQAYLEGIEPIEPTLKAVDPTLAIILEERMMAVRSAIEARVSESELADAVDQALASITWARDSLSDQDRSAWFAFSLAASILLREGLEAFLIILAMLGVIRAAGHDEAARWVHAGWMSALFVGVIGWFLSDALLQFGAAQREIIEGAIALLAVVVLLYVGFWLHSKTEIHKWTAYIDGRVKHQLNQGNLFGLAAISFVAVFREAFESVLFLSALTLEQGAGAKLAVVSGAVVAILLVIAVGVVLLRYSKRLPIKTLFQYASLIMAFLAVVLAGKGVHALQEAGLVSVTPVGFPIHMDLLGLYPTSETLIAQGATLAIAATIWLLPKYLFGRRT